MNEMPASARLAWWGTAWLRGEVVTDLAVDAIIGDDATHVIAGLDGPESATLPLALGLGRLRRAGLDWLGIALPVDGDPLGLGGPPSFNRAALDAGEAVVSSSIGLVPLRSGAAMVWHAYDAHRRPTPDLGEADRGLRAGLVEAARELARLDVARWCPEIADELISLRRPSPVDSPPGTPAKCVELAGRAAQALAITEWGLDDEGAAVSSYEMQARREALRQLARCARVALVASCSPDGWPG